MKEKILKKITIPILTFGIIGIVATIFTVAHLGPTSVQAQVSPKQNVVSVQDQEVQDDGISPKPSQSVSQKTDTQENDQIGTSDGEGAN